MYVRMHLCMYGMYAYMYKPHLLHLLSLQALCFPSVLCMHVCMYLCVYVCMHATASYKEPLSILFPSGVCVCMSVCMYVYVDVCRKECITENHHIVTL